MQTTKHSQNNESINKTTINKRVESIPNQNETIPLRNAELNRDTTPHPFDAVQCKSTSGVESNISMHNTIIDKRVESIAIQNETQFRCGIESQSELDRVSDATFN